MTRERVLELGEFVGRIVAAKVGGYAHLEYTVQRLRGRWPSNRDLIGLVAGTGQRPNGEVRPGKSDYERVVHVHND